MIALASAVRQAPPIPDYPLQGRAAMTLESPQARPGQPVEPRGVEVSPEEEKCPPPAFPQLADPVLENTPAEAEQQVQPPPLEWLLLATPRQGALAPHFETDASPEPMAPPPPVLPRPRTTDLVGDLPAVPVAAQVPAPVAAPVPPPTPNKPAPPPPRRGLPSWMVSGVVATGLLLVGWAVVYQYASARATDRAAAANPPADPPQQHQQAVPTTPVSYEISRAVEVTGLRVVADLKSHSQVHYIVVNHSGTPLPNLTLRLTVWSNAAAAAGQPLFTLSSSVPSLAPYASTEIQADVANLRAAAIPDWENLKPEVQISAQ
ncbi:MAG TPA: hypothetical protein VKU01_05945 [Bryobacteraceae bacterium]|nr:hypothetical protein [Bryobacteraceae bacterium]